MLVLALSGSGVASEASELRGDKAVDDDADGESGGVGKVCAKSFVSMRASVSKLMSGTA